MYSIIIRKKILELRNKIDETNTILNNKIINVQQNDKLTLYKLKEEVIDNLEEMVTDLDNKAKDSGNADIDEYVISFGNKLIDACDQIINRINSFKEHTQSEFLFNDKNPEEIDKELGLDKIDKISEEDEDEKLYHVKKVVLDMFMNEYDDIDYIIGEVRKMTDLINKTVEEKLNNSALKDNSTAAKKIAIMICEKSVELLKNSLNK